MAKTEYEIVCWKCNNHMGRLELYEGKKLEPIPQGVYFAIDNFYDAASRRGMGGAFALKWWEQRKAFPTRPDECKPAEPSAPTAQERWDDLKAWVDQQSGTERDMRHNMPGLYGAAVADIFRVIRGRME